MTSDSEVHVVQTLSGRNEFQVYLMLLLMFAGGSLIFLGADQGEPAAAFPAWAFYVWGGGILIGAVFNLVANFVRWRDAITGLRLEVLSCVLLGIAGLAYTVAYLLSDGELDPLNFLFIDLLVLISIVRLVRLLGWIKDIKNLRGKYGEVVDG